MRNKDTRPDIRYIQKNNIMKTIRIALDDELIDIFYFLEEQELDVAKIVERLLKDEYRRCVTDTEER